VRLPASRLGEPVERLEFRAQSLSELVLVRGTRTQARFDALSKPLTRFPRQFAAIPCRPGTVSYPMGASKVRVLSDGGRRANSIRCTGTLVKSEKRAAKSCGNCCPAAQRQLSRRVGNNYLGRSSEKTPAAVAQLQAHPPGLSKPGASVEFSEDAITRPRI
jgi:hypothetical protein